MFNTSDLEPDSTKWYGWLSFKSFLTNLELFKYAKMNRISTYLLKGSSK